MFVVYDVSERKEMEKGDWCLFWVESLASFAKLAFQKKIFFFSRTRYQDCIRRKTTGTELDFSINTPSHLVLLFSLFFAIIQLCGNSDVRWR